MAKYKPYSYDQVTLLPVSFKDQIHPGTFEYTLSYIIDHKIDLTVFEHKYSNDDEGRPAIHPGLLLKRGFIRLLQRDNRFPPYPGGLPD